MGAESDGIMWALELKDITKIFGTTPALRNINLRVERKKFLTIFGPNGAGKTTMIKILSTLMKPTSGEAWIMGMSLRKNRDEIRKIVGMLSHNTYLYPNLTPLENLEFYASLYEIEEARQRILEILNRVGLYERRNEPVRNLSFGMCKRLSIVRALISDPQVLLLDEPYTGLDVKAALTLREILQDIMGGERTVVMTTHDISVGLELCDEIIVLDRGRIIFSGNRSDINPQTFEKDYMELLECGGES